MKVECSHCRKRLEDYDALNIIGTDARFCQKCAVDPDTTEWFFGWNVITRI